MISLASSQILRWIDEINGVCDADEKTREIKSEIRQIKKEPNSIKNKKRIKQLYSDLDELQFQKDYMCLIIDRKQDYYRACKGFSINGVHYKRLLGTNPGIKNSTIVFVSEAVVDELKRRITNDRDMSKEFVTAKLEAYQALACSASNPVSMPHGIAIVNDAETRFFSDVINLTDENEGEPLMEFVKHQEIVMDCSDGFGLMMPSLAERWSKDLELDYVVSGVNTRFSFEKGMLFTFDYVDFAERVAGGNYIIKDAWGDEFDVRNVEAIFTTSMVKLWDSYSSCEDYLSKSLKNGYTFSVPKVCPETLDNERALNYQFIQPYIFDDDDINELVRPTLEEFYEVLGDDWRKTILFLCGKGLNENNVKKLNNDYIKATMIDERVIDDPYVRSHVYQLIKHRIDEAKVGILKVHGNYSILSGDPYALCQSMFGLEVTGLLKAGELYNKYWADSGAEKVVCFRAPMTCANNIVAMHPSRTEEVMYWYRYMKVVTILNAWDTTCATLNGADFDGDLIFITDNNVLVTKHRQLPALMCAQRKACKTIPTEEDFIRSNIDSFGNGIGQTTNWITSMFEVQSHFPIGSEEYNTLEYRIQCGEQAQQNEIDKAKGIISKPMERSWHDIHAVNKIDDDAKRHLYKSIVAFRKPYFMCYVYPALMREYKRYIKSVNRNSLREFEMTLGELALVPSEELTERQSEFLNYANYHMPVGTGDCVMNKICRIFENELDGFISKYTPSCEFDYTILKSDVEYTKYQYDAIYKLYCDYNNKLRSFRTFTEFERVDDYDALMKYSELHNEFKKECTKVCPNSKVLCNIVLDICYQRSSTKRFAWAMCGDEIISNLLEKNNNIISYPELCEDGEIQYCGDSFSVRTVRMEGS